MASYQGLIDRFIKNSPQEQELLAKIADLQRELELLRTRQRARATGMRDFAFVATMMNKNVSIEDYVDRLPSYAQKNDDDEALKAIADHLGDEDYRAIDEIIRPDIERSYCEHAYLPKFVRNAAGKLVKSD